MHRSPCSKRIQGFGVSVSMVSGFEVLRDTSSVGRNEGLSFCFGVGSFMYHCVAERSIVHVSELLVTLACCPRCYRCLFACIPIKTPINTYM